MHPGYWLSEVSRLVGPKMVAKAHIVFTAMVSTTSGSQSPSCQRYGQKGKTSDIMDVTPDEVPKVMAQYQVQHLIHGHTHRPMVHQLELADGSAAQRYVLGDWYSQSSYLDVSADGWQLYFNPLPQV